MTRNTKVAFFGPAALVLIAAATTFFGSLFDIKLLRALAVYMGVLGFLLLPIGLIVGVILVITNRKSRSRGR